MRGQKHRLKPLRFSPVNGFASAWREKYTPELTKLIIASDPHSPAGVRANGTPSNVDAFAKAFGCKEGDAMANSGDKKVAIW